MSPEIAVVVTLLTSALLAALTAWLVRWPDAFTVLTVVLTGAAGGWVATTGPLALPSEQEKVLVFLLIGVLAIAGGGPVTVGVFKLVDGPRPGARASPRQERSCVAAPGSVGSSVPRSSSPYWPAGPKEWPWLWLSRGSGDTPNCAIKRIPEPPNDSSSARSPASCGLSRARESHCSGRPDRGRLPRGPAGSGPIRAHHRQDLRTAEDLGRKFAHFGKRHRFDALEHLVGRHHRVVEEFGLADA